MEVKLAKTAGFCYGVQRAVDAVEQALEQQSVKQSDTVQTNTARKDTGRANTGPADAGTTDAPRAATRPGLYTYGPIVHNELVVDAFRARGVEVIEDFAALERMLSEGWLQGASVVIRAHGVGEAVMGRLLAPEAGVRVIDATCPYVRKIHELVRQHYGAGEQILVTGAADHPEVQGILGQIGGDAVVLATTEEAEAFRPADGKKLCVVSQTTFRLQKFEDIVAIFKKKRYDMNVINTICNATQRRQTEAAGLSAECDAMLVIGGRNSSNTAKLYDICRSECKKTYFIQSLADLKGTINNSVRCVGITAGASTPKSIIEEVLKYVRNEF